MKTIKIYGQTYTVHKSCKKEPNLYWHDGTLTDEPLNREPDGYVRMTDGNIVGVYNKKNLIIPIILGVVIIAGGVGAYTWYSNTSRPQALEGTLVKVAQPGNNEINFNTFLQCDGSNADVRFVNGDTAVRISVVGDGIQSKPTVVQPHETLSLLPMRYDTQEAAIEAQLVVEQDGGKYTYPIIVEIPQNLTAAGGSVTGDVHLISEDAHPLTEEMLLK